MNALMRLCGQIDMPQEAVREIARAFGVAAEYAHTFAEGLCDRSQYERAANGMHERIGEDRNGWIILTAMLQVALATQNIYRARNIPEDVFADTMKCFSRFVREHKVDFGAYAFDRWWWTGRQLSLSLYRIGALEYELAYTERGERAIAVHIPSDADLSAPSLDLSLAKAKTFFSRFEPDWEKTEYTCSSWLLSPALKELLPAQSKILQFQNRFRMINFFADNKDYRTWLFHGATEPEKFAENTSLQRAAKTFVLGGGKIGSAYGVLKRD